MKEERISKVLFLKDLGLNAHVHYMYLVKCTAGGPNCRGTYELKRYVFINTKPHSCHECYLDSMRKKRKPDADFERKCEEHKIIRWV